MSRKTRTTRKTERDNRSGQFVLLATAERHPNSTTRERILLPGHGEAREGGRIVYRTSPSGQFTERERSVVTSSKGERVVIYRDSKTGAFTSRKSAKAIRVVSKQAVASLRRLAKR